jgi:hypothetical protein
LPNGRQLKFIDYKTVELGGIVTSRDVIASGKPSFSIIYYETSLLATATLLLFQLLPQLLRRIGDYMHTVFPKQLHEGAFGVPCQLSRLSQA